jgi:Peptidase family C25/Concanavalin A-like lectin/glucanases superfamily/PQQ-like domain
MRKSFQISLVLLLLLTNLPLLRQIGPSAALAAAGQNALVLGGSSYISVPNSAALNPSSGITIEAWVKRSDASRCETIAGNNYIQSYWFGFCAGLAGNKLRFYTHGSGSAVDSVGGVPANIWTHVAVTYNGITRRYYINGVLDTTSTVAPGPLTPAPAGQPLGIGTDFDNQGASSLPFSGAIDEVRIWNYARSATQVRDSMFQPIGRPTSGLVAEWRFDGDANDPAGGHNGTPVGNPIYTLDGAIPHDIRIPQVATTLTLDTACGDSAYAGATQLSLGIATARLLHTASDMWVCIETQIPPTAGHDSWYAVYLDVDHSRLDPSQPDDLSLEVHIPPNCPGPTPAYTLRARAGTGSSNYTTTTLADGKWDGKLASVGGPEFPYCQGRFRISQELLGGWSHTIGLALAYHWLTGVGDDRLWPARADYDQPSTWSNAALGGTGAPHTFSGQVVYQPRGGGAPSGIPGAGVSLIGRDPAGGEALVAVARTDAGGSFSLTGDDDFPQHRLELDPYTLPRGYTPQSSSAGGPGVSVDARTIDYGTAAPGAYTNIAFSLSDALPTATDLANGAYFLIVAPQSIIGSGVLDEFAAYKRRLGFQVEVISTQTVNSSFSGATISDKIRALEKARRTSYGSRFKYVLLVGPHSSIPFRFLAPYNIKPADCHPGEGLASDWYYADLISSFDTNGNGCLGDGIWSKPEDRKAGYVPDVLNLRATVAVGRLPFSSPSAVRTALTNSMSFEQQAGNFKHRTMAAMSMMDLKARCWDPADNPSGAYTNCSDYNTDGAYLAETLQNDVLNPGGYSMTPFYENEHPATGSSPSHTISPQPATQPNVVAELADRPYGVVNLHGHGNGWGVYRTGWGQDANANGQVEQPTAPIGSPAHSQYEIFQPELLTNGGTSGLTPDNANGAIFVVASCSTGDFNDPNSFGAQVLAQGHGVGWFGGVTVVQYYLGWSTVNNGPYGGMSDMDYFMTRRLLDRNLRLGDATWQAMTQYIVNGNTDFSGLVFDLYGDPTLSYWGNPGGESTLAAWPMLRENALGAGYVTLNGPGVPTRLWSYGATAPGTTTLPPSPIVSNNGEVIVAHSSFVDVLRNGALYQRLNLDAAAFGTPALAADGTIYAADVTGKLYAFSYSLFRFCWRDSCYGSGASAPARSRRWKLDLGSPPLTSPVVGADGFVAIGRVGGNFLGFTFSNVTLVRPDGRNFRDEPVLGNAVGALTVSPDRVVYASTSTGAIARIDFFCATGTCKTDDAVIFGSPPANTTPPLLAYGSLYVGRADGRVVRKNPSSLAQLGSFTADSAITAGPIAGPGGQVLVGTQNGTLYSLSSSLALRWQRNLGTAIRGVPAFASDALYIVSGDRLRAYNPFSGAQLWTRLVGAGAGHGTAAVGYGREVYVQSSSGTVAAFGEGWASPPLYVLADPVLLQKSSAVEVRWVLNPPSAASQALSGVHSQAAASGYLLQRRATNGDWQDVATLPPGTTIYTDTDVTQGASYAYRVQALDAGGKDSDFTTMGGEVRTLPAPPPAPTLDSVATLAADSLGLAWHAPAGAEVSGYRVERASGASGPFAPIATTTGETSVFTDTGLLPGTTSFYHVVALNDAGASGPSNVLSATTRQRGLSAPQNVAATLLPDGRVQISWSGGPAGATAIVEVNPLGLAGYMPLGTAGTAGPYTYDPGLPSSFGYRVKFVQGANESDYGMAALRVRTRGFVGVQRFDLYLPGVRR